MLEHFSAGAIAAIRQAQEEARRAEFSRMNAAHVVMGLASDPAGLAGQALAGAGFDVRRARLAAGRIWGRGYESAQQIIPADEAREVFEGAVAIASQTSPLLVDTQDLLRAVLAQTEGRGHELLRAMGIDTAALLDRLMAAREAELAGSAVPRASAEALPRHYHPRLLAPLARKALDRAEAETRAAGHHIIGTEQLLLGLLETAGGTAAAVLAHHGLHVDDVRGIVHRVIGTGSGTVRPPVQSRYLGEACERAWQAALARHHAQVGTGHLLLGMLDLDTGGALHMLDMLKAPLSALQYDLEQAFEADPRAVEPVW
ncbi:MAG: Clp protease N-terminal domain-containing protein [Candidatus Sericytochromatia bacterium]|nr:Clp protease N-terminal domain-containing protein [Candidatus Sericytochromatia bacterium]